MGGKRKPTKYKAIGYCSCGTRFTVSGENYDRFFEAVKIFHDYHKGCLHYRCEYYMNDMQMAIPELEESEE